MWAQVLRVILTHPFIFIAWSAVLVSLGGKVDLAKFTTPPTLPASPSHVILPTPPSNGPSLARPTVDSLSDPVLCSSDSFSPYPATTQTESDLYEHHQGQVPSSEDLDSLLDALSVADDELWNTDSDAFQGHGQSDYFGEDATITVSVYVSPPISSVPNTDHPGLTFYLDDYVFSDSYLGRSELEYGPDVATSIEVPSPSPTLSPWDDELYGREIELKDLLGPACVGLIGFLVLLVMSLHTKYSQKFKPSCYTSLDQFLNGLRVPLLETHIKFLVKAHKATTEQLEKEEWKNEGLRKMNEKAYQELLRLDKRISEAHAGPKKELQDTKHDPEELKQEVAFLHAHNKDLSTRLIQRNKRSAELKGLLDSANAQVERLEGSVATREQEAQEANNATLQAIAEASEARKEAEASRAAAETARLELDARRVELESLQLQLAKFKEEAEAAREGLNAATTRVDAILLENTSLKMALSDSEEKAASAQQALAESEEKSATVQKEADAALSSMESELNTQKLLNEILARDYERALATQAIPKVGVTSPNFDENASVPVQPSEEPAVAPTPEAEPQSSPAKDGLAPSSASAPTSNHGSQSWQPSLGFTIEVPRATSFPKYEPGIFGISFGKEPNVATPQGTEASASCGGSGTSDSDSMALEGETSSTPLSAISGSIFSTGPTTIPMPMNPPSIPPLTTAPEGFPPTTQQSGAPIPQPDFTAYLDSLVALMQAGPLPPLPQDGLFAGAPPVTGQDPNVLTSQDVEALLALVSLTNPTSNPMEVETSAVSNTATDSNAATVNPPMAVDPAFDPATTAVPGDPAPSQEFAGEPDPAAIFDSILADMEADPGPPPSQGLTFAGAPSTINQQWDGVQPGPTPGFSISLGQEPNFGFVPNVVPQMSMGNVAEQPVGNVEPVLQQGQDALFNWIFGSSDQVSPNANGSLGSSQAYNFTFTPPAVPQLGNIAVEPNPPVVPSTPYPPTEPSPTAIPPPFSFGQPQETENSAGNPPFASNPASSYASTPSSLAYPNSLAPPPVASPSGQIPETAPINPSYTANATVPFQAPVAAGDYVQAPYEGTADVSNDEVSLGEDDDEEEDSDQVNAPIYPYREDAPSPELVPATFAGQGAFDSDSDDEEFEDMLASLVNHGTGDVVIPLSPPPTPASDPLSASSNAQVASMEETAGPAGMGEGGVSPGDRCQNEDEEEEEGALRTAAFTPKLDRAIRPLPKSLRKAQDNGAGQVPAGRAVESEATADEGDSSDAWGAGDEEDDLPTPPRAANGERAVRPLPRSRFRARAPPMVDEDATRREGAPSPEGEEGAWRTSSPLPTSPEQESALHSSFGEYYRPPPVDNPDPEGPVWDSDQED